MCENEMRCWCSQHLILFAMNSEQFFHELFPIFAIIFVNDSIQSSECHATVFAETRYRWQRTVAQCGHICAVQQKRKIELSYCRCSTQTLANFDRTVIENVSRQFTRKPKYLFALVWPEKLLKQFDSIDKFFSLLRSSC